MEHYIFTQLKFVRNETIDRVTGINEEASLVIPNGFNNNIKWHLGHMYLVLERFAFHFVGEKVLLPEEFVVWFGNGSKPADWGEQVLPSTRELVDMLDGQVERVEHILQARLKEVVAQPYTTSRGLTLSTVEEFLSFCLYHEGMHFDAIKTMKRMGE